MQLYLCLLKNIELEKCGILGESLISQRALN